MISEIQTVSFQGIQAVRVSVQVQIAGGSLPSFSIVGLPDKAVNESKERIRSALHTLGIALPAKRITMNLSPADIQKEGNHYDLPLALALLMALDILPGEVLSQAIAIGE
jgi:magnesium chelatase family protein